MELRSRRSSFALMIRDHRNRRSCSSLEYEPASIGFHHPWLINEFGERMNVAITITAVLLLAIPVFGTLIFGTAKLKNRRNKFWQPLRVGLRFSRYRREFVVRCYSHIALFVLVLVIAGSVVFRVLRFLFQHAPTDEGTISLGIRTALLIAVVLFFCFPVLGALRFGYSWYHRRVFKTDLLLDLDKPARSLSWTERCYLTLCSALGFAILLGYLSFGWMRALENYDGQSRRARAISRIARIHRRQVHWQDPIALAVASSASVVLLLDAHHSIRRARTNRN